MKTNMGSMDRIIRIVLAIVFTALYFTDTVTGTMGIILLIVSGVFVMTSLISSCPLYAIAGISSCPVKEQTL